MRHKFLGTGDPGYHPLRKLRTVFSGLRYAVVYDFSVAYKLVLSALVLAVAYAPAIEAASRMSRPGVDLSTMSLAPAQASNTAIVRKRLKIMD